MPPHSSDDEPPFSSEDKELWERITETVTPFKNRSKHSAPPQPPVQGRTPKPSKRFDLSGAIAHFFGRKEVPLTTPTPTSPISSPHIPGIDKSTIAKLTKGQYPIDRRIDLHGLSQEKAYTTLHTAIHQAFSDGKRCLLVITGKGKEGNGILRQRLPEWVSSPDLNPLVLTTLPAHRKHGGDGAFYILLRRDRGR